MSPMSPESETKRNLRLSIESKSGSRRMVKAIEQNGVTKHSNGKMEGANPPAVRDSEQMGKPVREGKDCVCWPLVQVILSRCVRRAHLQNFSHGQPVRQPSNDSENAGRHGPAT